MLFIKLKSNVDPYHRTCVEKHGLHIFQLQIRPRSKSKHFKSSSWEILPPLPILGYPARPHCCKSRGLRRRNGRQLDGWLQNSKNVDKKSRRAKSCTAFEVIREKQDLAKGARTWSGRRCAERWSPSTAWCVGGVKKSEPESESVQSQHSVPSISEVETAELKSSCSHEDGTYGALTVQLHYTRCDLESDVILFSSTM